MLKCIFYFIFYEGQKSDNNSVFRDENTAQKRVVEFKRVHISLTNSITFKRVISA